MMKRFGERYSDSGETGAQLNPIMNSEVSAFPFMMMVIEFNMFVFLLIHSKIYGAEHAYKSFNVRRSTTIHSSPHNRTPAVCISLRYPRTVTSNTVASFVLERFELEEKKKSNQVNPRAVG
ncbi:uncharacterized protein BT62DRAFT_635351 [Guyanagaster necrorhizus]|uniref:Uncharacterized protein n=1 Tax=Guyanagaster necrorhizus TaxID=856835 RepID=A0A9P8AM10_9AGAR|nr:uncharacterized protein BT62DRAFT_635351 [Guyanagaster necrorhizus MCA 3950]KAG7440181.1 hypothetical protein BT62DRAFT_635351 [Guyanagaster necrorhizus MCA 3950]